MKRVTDLPVGLRRKWFACQGWSLLNNALLDTHTKSSTIKLLRQYVAVTEDQVGSVAGKLAIPEERDEV